MFIIDIEYIVSLEEIDAHLKLHRDFLDSRYQEGLLLASGPKNPREGGIVIALGSDLHVVEAMIKDDPFYQRNLARYTITEFTPVKHRTEIAPLIL